MSLNVLPYVGKQSTSLSDRVDLYRLDANRKLNPVSKSLYGQFMTNSAIAKFMASLFKANRNTDISLLDAGAGIGSLSCAFIEEFCNRPQKPKNICLKAFEIDNDLVAYLGTTLNDCVDLAKDSGIDFQWEIINQDFINTIVDLLGPCNSLFQGFRYEFTHAILNPPYKKVSSQSNHHKKLSSCGLQSPNLYTAFLALTIQLLKPGGELVAITPRSFCNGTYFKNFRKFFLKEMAVTAIHVFESRDKAFNDDEVLQENIIFHAVKNGKGSSVIISSSDGPDFMNITTHELNYTEVVRPNDTEMFIHIAPDELNKNVSNRMKCFTQSLSDLDVSVSTGRVVDFRAESFLRANPEPDTVPLIYPAHCKLGKVKWPIPGIKKPNAIQLSDETEPLLLPSEYYVLVKRFSAKEEIRRIVPTLYEPIPACKFVAFENHSNVFHSNNSGLPLNLARGLVLYLSSSLIDIYFRQFSGHTQVNASDLRKLPYPPRHILEELGNTWADSVPQQHEIDGLIEREIQKMVNNQSNDPIQSVTKINEALEILTELGFPRAQQNDRSALTLLALLNLKPDESWSNASERLIGITPIMEFCRDFYGKVYAPNTRETFRRQTMHQFVAAGLAVENPDRPNRPINSPAWGYKIDGNALNLIRSFGTTEWKQLKTAYSKVIEPLKKQYAREREMEMIPVKISENTAITLTPGKHNELINAIVSEFAPRFTPGGHVLYVGDTGDKWGYYDGDTFLQLGIEVDPHGKMPDVVIFYAPQNWLILVEAVTSHGPVDGKRRKELANLFAKSKAGLVYVTAFLTRADMSGYLGDISWETEVWVAESPTHLIHFNGVRFLGPYAT